MALHPNFPKSPHAILDPSIRWFPADETLRETTMDKLMPPLVPELRKRVRTFRDSDYAGATRTSRSLLGHWFREPHLLPSSGGTMIEFQYYFAQREALETIVYLYEVLKTKDKYDFMRLAPEAPLSAQHFPEDWQRYVIKMATGAGLIRRLFDPFGGCFAHGRVVCLGHRTWNPAALTPWSSCPRPFRYSLARPPNAHEPLPRRSPVCLSRGETGL